MPEWKQCKLCGYWFDYENLEKDCGLVYFHGQAVAHICSHCIPDKKEKEKINDTTRVY